LLYVHDAGGGDFIVDCGRGSLWLEKKIAGIEDDGWCIDLC